ncbi:unnamed protein product [Coccothraustes coccothraustes]
MLSARRSRFFASASRRERPLLRREERRRTTVAFSAQPSNPARTEPRFGEHCYRHNAQCAKKPLLRLREPEARPLLRREERRRTTVAFSAQPSNSSRTVPFQSPTF